MADAFQTSAALANQMTAASLPYQQQAADIGTPLAAGVRAGTSMAIEADQIEIQQALAEAQAEDLEVRRVSYQQELALRGMAAQTRMAELELAKQELALQGQRADDDRRYRGMMLMREMSQAGPLPLGNGRFLWVGAGAGGEVSSMEVDESHPAVVAWKQDQDLSRRESEALIEQRRNPRYSRGGADGVSISDRMKMLSERAKDLRSQVMTSSLKPEEKARLEKQAADYERQVDELLSGGAGGGMGEGLDEASPEQQMAKSALTRARSVAFAKVPGLERFDDAGAQRLMSTAVMGLRATGQDRINGRRATDDELQAAIIEQLLNPQQPEMRDALVTLLLSGEETEQR